MLFHKQMAALGTTLCLGHRHRPDPETERLSRLLQQTNSFRAS